MKFGVCGSPAIADDAARAGFDYLELTCATVRDLSDGELDELRKTLAEKGLTVGSLNCFFPSTVHLIGAQANLPEALNYAERNLNAARRLGVPVCVVGSGGSRKIPEGFDPDEARESFAAFLDQLGDLGAERGVKIALEPLNRSETNLINTVTEGIALCRQIGNRNVGCLVDFYHFFRNGEDLSELDAFRPGELPHVHLARPNVDRNAPGPDDAPVLAAWADKLKQIGYDGSLSLECGWKPNLPSLIGQAAEQLRVFGKKEKK